MNSLNEFIKYCENLFLYRRINNSFIFVSLKIFNIIEVLLLQQNIYSRKSLFYNIISREEYICITNNFRG